MDIPASGTKNTDEPNPATVPTISEKNAIRKRGKRTLKWRCWTLIEQAPEREQKMTSL
jgi:hypothetical protein